MFLLRKNSQISPIINDHCDATWGHLDNSLFFPPNFKKGHCGVRTFFLSLSSLFLAMLFLSITICKVFESFWESSLSLFFSFSFDFCSILHPREIQELITYRKALNLLFFLLYFSFLSFSYFSLNLSTHYVMLKVV